MGLDVVRLTIFRILSRISKDSKDMLQTESYCSTLLSLYMYHLATGNRNKQYCLQRAIDN